MKIYYRTPKLFTYAGFYLEIFGKRYRILKIGRY